MVVVFRIIRSNSLSENGPSIYKYECQNTRKSFFAKTLKNYSILIAIFQRPVIKPSVTDMRGPDTSTDAYVWPG